VKGRAIVGGQQGRWNALGGPNEATVQFFEEIAELARKARWKRSAERVELVTKRKALSVAVGGAGIAGHDAVDLTLPSAEEVMEAIAVGEPPVSPDGRYS
jgi:hypothetical protein